MNREQTREAGKTMLAWADGGDIRWKKRNSHGWSKAFNSQYAEISWDWTENEYQRMPKATIRPWTMAECPVGEVVVGKENNRGSKYVITCNGPEGICVPSGTDWEKIDYPVLLADYTMLNGDPCGVREEGDL